MVAIKKVRCEEPDVILSCLHESDNQQALKHQNIVASLDIFKTQKNDKIKIFIVMEFCGGGDLDGFIKGLQGLYNNYKKFIYLLLFFLKSYYHQELHLLLS